MGVKTQPVIGDIGSNENDQMRRVLNALLDAIDTAADFAALQTAVRSLTNDIVKVVETRNLPRQRQFPRRG